MMLAFCLDVLIVTRLFGFNSVSFGLLSAAMTAVPRFRERVMVLFAGMNSGFCSSVVLLNAMPSPFVNVFLVML